VSRNATLRRRALRPILSSSRKKSLPLTLEGDWSGTEALREKKNGPMKSLAAFIPSTRKKGVPGGVQKQGPRLPAKEEKKRLGVLLAKR